jgi:hypothetical protein
MGAGHSRRTWVNGCDVTLRHVPEESNFLTLSMFYSSVSSRYEEMEEVRGAYRSAQGSRAKTSWKMIWCRDIVKDNTKTDHKKVEFDSLDLTGLVWALLCKLHCLIVMPLEAKSVVKR